MEGLAEAPIPGAGLLPASDFLGPAVRGWAFFCPIIRKELEKCLSCARTANVMTRIWMQGRLKSPSARAAPIQSWKVIARTVAELSRRPPAARGRSG